MGLQTFQFDFIKEYALPQGLKSGDLGILESWGCNYAAICALDP